MSLKHYNFMKSFLKCCWTITRLLHYIPLLRKQRSIWWYLRWYYVTKILFKKYLLLLSLLFLTLVLLVKIQHAYVLIPKKINKNQLADNRIFCHCNFSSLFFSKISYVVKNGGYNKAIFKISEVNCPTLDHFCSVFFFCN